jgi:hypothetical protein
LRERKTTGAALHPTPLYLSTGASTSEPVFATLAILLMLPRNVQLRLQDAQDELRKAGMQEGRKEVANLSPRHDEEDSWFPAFLPS